MTASSTPVTSTIEDLRPRPASVRSVATILTWCHLSWLWVAWALFAVGLIVILGVQLVRGGDVDRSIWEQIGFGIQGWVIFAAGITTVPVYVAMIVSGGVTRRRLSEASIAAMVVVAVAGTAVVMAGYLIERIAFASGDWPHVLDDGSTVLAAGTAGRIAITSLLSFAAFFVSGWIIGTCFYRFGSATGIAAIVPALIPAIVVDTLLGGPINVLGTIDVLRDRADAIVQPHLAIGVVGSLVAVVAACVVARQLTVETPIKN